MYTKAAPKMLISVALAAFKLSAGDSRSIVISEDKEVTTDIDEKHSEFCNSCDPETGKIVKYETTLGNRLKVHQGNDHSNPKHNQKLKSMWSIVCSTNAVNETLIQVTQIKRVILFTL